MVQVTFWGQPLCAKCYARYFVTATHTQTELGKDVAPLALPSLPWELDPVVVRRGPLAQVLPGMRALPPLATFGCPPSYSVRRACSRDS